MTGKRSVFLNVAVAAIVLVPTYSMAQTEEYRPNRVQLGTFVTVGDENKFDLTTSEPLPETGARRRVPLPKPVRTPRQVSRSAPSYTGDVPAIIRKVGAEFWSDRAQLDALLWIANKESTFRPNAVNPSGKYFGLFQLNSGMAAGNPWSDPAWNTRRACQYIQGRYGTPLDAKAHHLRKNWY